MIAVIVDIIVDAELAAIVEIIVNAELVAIVVQTVDVAQVESGSIFKFRTGMYILFNNY